jgi:hypothetical protein
MKPMVVMALFVSLVATISHAETFVGPTTATNHLLVSSNSAIIITSTFGDFTNSTAVSVDGGFAFPQFYFAPLGNGSAYALAGPAELVFSNAAVITYFEVTNTSIMTQGIANDPIGIPIPTNKTMRLFGVWAPVNASFYQPGSSPVSFTLQPGQPAEFTGPGSLYLNSGVFPPYIKFISYFFAEDGFALPNERFIAGPTGSHVVSVEKSFDLNTWSPILLGTTSDPTSAYYRLRIQP